MPPTEENAKFGDPSYLLALVLVHRRQTLLGVQDPRLTLRRHKTA
ncbi:MULTISPECIES: hypothetical protein [Streptomyces]